MQIWENITILEQIELVSMRDMTEDKIVTLELVYQNIFYENETVVHKVVGNEEITYASSLLREKLDSTLSYIFKTDKVILTTMAMDQIESILNMVKEALNR